MFVTVYGTNKISRMFCFLATSLLLESNVLPTIELNRPHGEELSKPERH